MEKAIAMWVFYMANSLFLPDIQTIANFLRARFLLSRLREEK